MCEVRSDGRENLIGALIAAGNLDVPEVCVYFNNKLLRGNRTTKLDNWGLDAFTSPNTSPLAVMDISINGRRTFLLVLSFLFGFWNFRFTFGCEIWSIDIWNCRFITFFELLRVIFRIVCLRSELSPHFRSTKFDFRSRTFC